jgi:hypothetical protein
MWSKLDKHKRNNPKIRPSLDKALSRARSWQTKFNFVLFSQMFKWWWKSLMYAINCISYRLVWLVIWSTYCNVYRMDFERGKWYTFFFSLSMKSKFSLKFCSIFIHQRLSQNNNNNIIIILIIFHILNYFKLYILFIYLFWESIASLFKFREQPKKVKKWEMSQKGDEWIFEPWALLVDVIPFGLLSSSSLFIHSSIHRWREGRETKKALFLRLLALHTTLLCALRWTKRLQRATIRLQ